MCNWIRRLWTWFWKWRDASGPSRTSVGRGRVTRIGQSVGCGDRIAARSAGSTVATCRTICARSARGSIHSDIRGMNGALRSSPDHRGQHKYAK